MEVDRWDVHPDRPIERCPIVFCSFPSLKDPEHDPGPGQRHTGEAITFVPWESFEPWLDTRWKRRPEGYDEFKQHLTDVLLEQYLDSYPRLRGMVDHVEMSTPLSTHHFARSARGSIYGLGTEPGRFADPSIGPKTDIKGLFMGGVDASAPGIVGALGGGALAAAAAEPAKAARFLQPIMRRPR
jgi:all-trans-retinol 13,14-reductase